LNQSIDAAVETNSERISSIGESMTNTMMHSQDTSGVDWQLLGKYTFTRESLPDNLVSAWLANTLRPLNLKTSLIDKILTSAQLAAESTLQLPSSNRFKHIHLLIFTSAMHPSDGQNWGFFRIEKIGPLSEENQSPDHAIEFYLYLEGK
jgi:hypothetical protein